MNRDHETAAPGALAVLVFAGTFLFRWLTIDFDNDYFMHLAWAAEMLRGQWPVRDFVEPGFPLQTGLAYAGLRLGGYQLFWEGVIACTMIAVGATFTYLICLRLGVRRWLAVTATLVAIGAYPRLYAYPKAVAYPAALWALARYTSRAGLASAAVAGAVTGGAFLLRHDHGVYIALATWIGIALYHGRHWRSAVRAVVQHGVVAGLVVAPWVGWVQLSGHADQYWRFLTGQAHGLSTGQRAPDLSITLNQARPLIQWTPIEYPLVGIRWAPGTSRDEQRDRERRYGLERGANEERYRLTDTSTANVRALVQDPTVEDTSGIDRGTLRVPDALVPWLYFQLQRYVPIVRLRVLPGAVNAANAMPWLAWTTFVLPGLALVALAIHAVRSPATRRAPGAVIGAAAILSVITYQTLVRASPDSRLGDVAALSAILLAWMAERAWRARSARVVIRAIAAVALGLTVLSAASFGGVVGRLAAAGVDGPIGVVRQTVARADRYRSRPIDVFAPREARGLPRLARWLNTCTPERARVAVLGFEPQIMVIAERGFAGGMAFYDLGWLSSESDQRLILERWEQQYVPVVFAIESEWGSFSRDYSLVRASIDRDYRFVRRSSFGGVKEVRVFVSKSVGDVRIDGDTGLPCLR